MQEQTTFSNLSEQLARADDPGRLLSETLAELDVLQAKISGQVRAGASTERYERLQALSDALAAARHTVILGISKCNF